MKCRMIAITLMGGICWLTDTPAIHAAEVCTAIADAATGKVLMQRGDCERQVTPASTFKIPLSLMGYDAGFLKDEQAPELPFRPGYVDWRPSWRTATGPAGWMRESVVWYSQQITQALGKARFAAYTKRFGYGNQDVSEYVQFTASAGVMITSLSFSNAPEKDAFEAANFSVTTPIPEPSTSALLLAGLYANGQNHLRDPPPTRAHTQRLPPPVGLPLPRRGQAVRRGTERVARRPGGAGGPCADGRGRSRARPEDAPRGAGARGPERP